MSFRRSGHIIRSARGRVESFCKVLLAIQILQAEGVKDYDSVQHGAKTRNVVGVLNSNRALSPHLARPSSRQIVTFFILLAPDRLQPYSGGYVVCRPP
jgi:hypothetical protein